MASNHSTSITHCPFAKLQLNASVKNVDSEYLPTELSSPSTGPRSASPTLSTSGSITSYNTNTSPSVAYEVKLDPQLGFLPLSAPLTRLPAGPWQVWEEAWEATEGFRPGVGESNSDQIHNWRVQIRDGLGVVDVEDLSQNVECLRRAHALLAFMTHAYVHSAEAGVMLEEVVVPRALAIPLCRVSEMLDMPPALTYSDQVLHNWSMKDPKMGFTASNIIMGLSFTRTPSEQHFFQTSLLMETVGPAYISTITSCLQDCLHPNPLSNPLRTARITDHLTYLAILTDRLRSIIDTTRSGCEPNVFYWEMAPWYVGGRWVMEGVHPQAGQPTSTDGWRVRDFGGAGPGQSGLVHALDIFIGVDHRTRPQSSACTHASAATSSSAGSANLPAGDETFFERMAPYMPYHQRAYLTNLATSLSPAPGSSSYPPHSVRTLSRSSPPGSPLRVAYDACVTAMDSLRKSHSRIACLYIISQARMEPPSGSALRGDWEKQMAEDRKKAEARRVQGEITGVGGKGGGGTVLAQFLRRCAARTKEAFLSS